MNSTYIRGTDVAKLARVILKEAFPGTKFSVRTCRSTGTLNISWTDGPVEGAVKDKVGILAGKDFDGMIDLSTYRDDLPVAAFTGKARKLAAELAEGGDALSLGSGFVFTHRGFSEESWKLAGAEIAKQRGVEVEFTPRGEISGSYEPDAYLVDAEGRSRDSYSWREAASGWLHTLAL